MKWEDTSAMPESRWCRSVEPVEGAPPFGAALLAQLGLDGLQFGPLDRRHPSCLNTDICALTDFGLRSTEPGRLYRIDGRSHFIQLDARQPLPFEDASFRFVYAEHFIEHITLREAGAWLREVKRILRSGGFVRITTPDLRRYVEGYLDPQDAFFAQHRERAREMGLPRMERRKAWMVNQIFQFWGHKWIYDADELRHVLAEAGFAEASFGVCAFQQGRDAAVAALDWPARSDETLYVEATA